MHVYIYIDTTAICIKIFQEHCQLYISYVHEPVAATHRVSQKSHTILNLIFFCFSDLKLIL